MLNDNKTGGPAFPGPYMNDAGAFEVVGRQGGMTLRDYFAAKALAGMLADPDVSFDEGGRDEWVVELAGDSYALADAMLAARGQGAVNGDETVSVLEAWKAAGGDSGEKVTKDILLGFLHQCAMRWRDADAMASQLIADDVQRMAAPADHYRAMVDRFLGWKLPKDFGPDAGISFNPSKPYEEPGWWPVGTNLFTADQARAMFEYCVELPVAEKPSIVLTPSEVQSGLDRVRFAELLIRQLPENHDGRNTWLLNYGSASSNSPDADGWIEWKGGECPVPAGTLVDYRMADGDEDRSLAVDLDWGRESAMPMNCHIIAYRVVEGGAK